MELSILNSLLHGNLKPWNLNTSDKKPFMECVKLANAISQDSKSNLYERSRALLTSFPELQKKLKETKPLKDGPIQMPLFEIEKPEHNDVFTRFYALLIDNEALRFANLLSAEVSKKPVDLDKQYAIKQALRSIKTLTQQSARELGENGSDAQNTLTNFALSYLKQSMIALYFDVQEQYKSHLKAVFTEEEFRAEILDEPRSGTEQLKPSKAYFEIQIQNLLTHSSYSETNAKELLSKMQSLQTLQSLQTALENLIFLHSLSAEKIPTTISELSEPAFVKQQLSFEKKSFENSIHLLPFGHERLSIIQEALEDLDYTFSNAKTSIPSLFQKWLIEQKNIYVNRFSEKFPVTTISVKDTAKPSKNSFGFNGDTSKLKNVVIQLNRKIELINEVKTSTDEFVTLLTAKDFTKVKTKIFIGCETAQFRYIIDQLKPYFLNLNPTSISNSGVFYSKSNRKVTYQNLYSSKIGNPKNKEDIDRIIKQLQ